MGIAALNPSYACCGSGALAAICGRIRAGGGAPTYKHVGRNKRSALRRMFVSVPAAQCPLPFGNLRRALLRPTKLRCLVGAIHESPAQFVARGTR